MIEMLDFQSIQESSDDRRELQSLLRQLMGLPFLFFRVSYGDELSVHLGEAREYSSPKMKGRRKGSYILSARASCWFFRPNTQPTMYVGTQEREPESPHHARQLDIREIESSPLVEAGSVVASIGVVLSTAGGFGLTLCLSDRSTLIILPAPPSPSDDGVGQAADGDELADWEVFTPYDRYLRVGPGPHWSYRESNKPAGG